jgi:Lon protease-like protein
MSLKATSASSNTEPIPEVLPIFPLPNVVFFPYTYLPLHIFEPRYREMVQDAACRGECIGMALLKEGWEERYYESPPIFELGCVGRLVTVNSLSNGRYHIVLKGLRRCIYMEQVVETSYRQAKVNLLSSQERDELGTTLRNALMESSERYLQSKNAHDLCQVIASGKLNDQTLVNSLSAGLDFTSVEKQFLLESENLLQQARRLRDLIRFKLPTLQPPVQG